MKNVPYRVIGEDLAAVFVVLVEKDNTGIMTVKINQDFLTYWELSEEELWILANKNTPKLLPVENGKPVRFVDCIIQNIHRKEWCNIKAGSLG